ncbi:MAG: hypothetical protein LBP80_02865 [Treponema sp.]|nr:hypothetical protein [Treponema sp.]
MTLCPATQNNWYIMGTSEQATNRLVQLQFLFHRSRGVLHGEDSHLDSWKF